MEKIIEKNTMNKVFEVIEKHRNNHIICMNEARNLCMIANHLGESDEEFRRDVENHASALACLKMLEMELKGERKY